MKCTRHIINQTHFRLFTNHSQFFPPLYGPSPVFKHSCSTPSAFWAVSDVVKLMFVQLLISAAGRTGILQKETHHSECFVSFELTGQEWWPAAKHQVFLAATHLSLQPQHQVNTVCSTQMTSALSSPSAGLAFFFLVPLNPSLVQLLSSVSRFVHFLSSN